jgi:hypothetical protein
MKLPDFSEFEPLNKLKDQMGIPRDHHGSFPQAGEDALSPAARPFILLKSGNRLDLLDPDPNAWTDEDLAIGLSRTYRWGGYSKWDLPLSVAQHSLTVLALREMQGRLTAREALREICHDATEALIGWDCFAQLKPHLGEAYERLDRRLQDAVDQRYKLPAWTREAYQRHKHAGRLAASSEAAHVIGWSPQDIRESFGLALAPIENDPLAPTPGMQPWEPWPPKLAEALFLDRLNRLLRAAGRTDSLGGRALAQAFSRLPAAARSRCAYPPTGDRLKDTLVHVKAGDHSMELEGVVVDGPRDESGAFDLDAEFTVFTPSGELIRVNGANCHVEIL